ncbi:DNA polymerase V subunit UmuC [Spirochaetia bacterium]|nr:DNA polymerase V subunit UmuC [Spirochaetia bacterium]
MIMHIDGNSFYASCERLFRPDLSGKPIVVLTNNDGIIIALTQEAKDKGFKRGDIYFKNKQKLDAAEVAVFSSNYTLYADMCARVNVIYNRYAIDVEMYSIDESFLYFPDWNNADYSEIGRGIRNTVKLETGIPVSVGIAPTKTLAKLCNKLAKNYDGICEWSKLDQDEILKNYPACDIWGIGRSKAKLLSSQNVHTALDLKNYPLDKAKKHLTIMGFRTVQELNGISAITKTEHKAHQNIIVSRSFSSAVHHLNEIITPLSEHAQEAVKRLRADKIAARYVTVYLMTSPYGEGVQYSNSATAALKVPTSFLPDISHTAVELLRQIYRKGYNYRKVLIALDGLIPDKNIQQDLFEDTSGKEKNEKIMKAFDKINNKYGRGTIHLGMRDLAKSHNDDNEHAPWIMKRELLSPCYTTLLSDIPKVG